MSEFCDLLARHCHESTTVTAIPRLILSRSEVPTKPREAIYYPLLCVVARGRKRVFLGGETFDYAAATYLLASAGLPATGQVAEAPYLGLTFGLELEVLASLLLVMPPRQETRPPGRALAVNELDDDLLGCLVRLLRLLDHPERIPVLAPLLERELHYHLLLGPQREMVRHLGMPASQLSQISRAFNLLRQRFNQTIRVEELARLAGMSTPTFHRHFRAVTSMSPLQYQKQIRLQEARRLLQTQHAKASSVAYAVGYESSSQFNREYRRMFGITPNQDGARARGLPTPRQHASLLRS